MTIATERPADTTIPTIDQILARIAELQPLLERNAAQGETDRRVVEESITALTEAGVFKIAQPRRHGGYGMPVRAMLDVSAAVGEADGGTAWVVALCNVCAWMAGLFGEQAQDDIWSANPDAKVSGVLTPTAETTKVDGGYRVTGRWYYNSGSWHADWAAVGIPLTDENGEIVDQGMALIPRTDLGLEDTWFVAGMRSSGSNCLIAEDVFVPEHRIVSVPPAIAGQYANAEPEEDVYRAALVPVLTVVLAGPQLGMGRKALKIVREKAARKAISYTAYATQAESVGFQLQLAEAAMRIDSAHLHTYRAVEDIDSAAAAHTYPDLTARARVRADTGWAVENITRAIDILLFAHGAASFAEVNPLQRIWRDSSVAARHAIVLPKLNYEVYGKALLGREDQITPLI